MQNLTIPLKIFIDADAYVALIDKKDPNYKKAKVLQHLLEKGKSSAYTSNFAVGEAITVISQKLGIALATEFAEYLFSGGVVIIEVNKMQMEKGLVKFSKQTSKNTRFTDMVNMVLMDELGITTIFSFDKHYPQNGYKLLGER